MMKLGRKSYHWFSIFIFLIILLVALTVPKEARAGYACTRYNENDCGTCQYCDYYQCKFSSNGTYCATCKSCDGNGNCNPDDSRSCDSCPGIDCGKGGTCNGGSCGPGKTGCHCSGGTCSTYYRCDPSCPNDCSRESGSCTVTCSKCPGGNSTTCCAGSGPTPAPTSPPQPTRPPGATPTPTLCPIPYAPTNLSVSISNPSATVFWDGVAGATGYALRVNDTTDGWDGSCSSPAGDFCKDLTSSSYTFNITPGHSYTWWVHTVNGCGWSDPAWGPNFGAPTPTPTPTPCNPPAIPSLSGSCTMASGEGVADAACSLDWNDVANTNYYALRVNDLVNGWSGTCAWTYAGDICTNTGASFYSFAGTGGHNYNAWVHAVNLCGWSNASYTSFSVPYATPTPTPIPAEVCKPAEVPTLTVVNQRTYENAIDFWWSSSNECVEYDRRFINAAGWPFDFYNNHSRGGNGWRTENVAVDGQDVYVEVKVRGKNTANEAVCQGCATNNPPDCCVSSWAGARRCSFCKHPTGLSTTEVDCRPEKPYNGTRISWTDQSNFEDGFVLYRCSGGICPQDVSDYFATVGRNVTSYTDCDFAFGTKTYAVRCFAQDCKLIPPLGPTPTPISGLPCQTVYGYVKTPTGQAIPGAQVTAHRISGTDCSGGHSGCTADTTDSNGRFDLSCTGDMGCLGVYEIAEALGYQDSTKMPTGPLGSSAWDVNTIVWPNPAPASCGPFTFYDVSSSCDCGEWTVEGCGAPCESNQRLESQYCYWSGTGQECDVNTRCLDDADCLLPWYQTEAGDVHSQGNIRSQIPGTVPASERYFSLDGETGFPGVVSYHGDNANFGAGEVSSRGWLAQASQSLSLSFNYFYQFLQTPSLQEPPASNTFLNSDLPAENGVAGYNGNIQTGDNWSIGSKKLVILIDGKFLIKNNITINNGGSLLVVASQGIGISENLKVTGGVGDKLQGVFVTDEMFYSSVAEASFEGEADFIAAVSDKILVIDGSVIAGKGVSLTRDLGDLLNPTTPAETFRFDPDLMMNSYSGLWQLEFTWQEVAP